MPKSRYERIAITLPAEDLEAADRAARQLDRSRSWLIAEAVRQYVARPQPAPDVAIADSRPGLGQSRRQQLLADLRLTPEERVRAAEETARVTTLMPAARVHRILAFDRYEDYLAWKKVEGLL